MNKEKEKQEILSKDTMEKELLRKLIPMMRSELVGFTNETEEGIVFTLPGGKQYRIWVEEL